jgi:hypothetical protein
MAETTVKKWFSAETLGRKLYDVVCRFPLAVAAIAALATLALMAIHDLDVNYRRWPILWFALTSSVAVTLAVEERWAWLKTLLAGLAVAALWGARCLFFPANDNDMTEAQWVEVGVVCGAAFFAVFFSAFLRRDTDAPWWNFSLRTLARLILGSLFSGTLFGGLVLAVHAVAELFDVNPPDEIFGWLSVACFVVFAPLYVLAGVPDGETKRDGELRPDHLLKVLALYILGPILAIYVLILYLYLAKIVVTWELPNGWVSWLVTTLGAGGLAMTLLLYPHRMRSGNRLIGFLSRWTGIIIAPLLLLMTVGIARRVSDYGWTPNRAYILLLNLWFYAIYAWLFIVRGRRVKWILVSAVVVALVSSVGPWSLARISPREDENAIPAAEWEEEGTWFSSDSTMVENVPVAIGREYDRFVEIRWDRMEETLKADVELTLRGDDLVIGLPKGNAEGESPREFVLSLDRVIRQREFRGEGFLFLSDECYGTRYETSDSIQVNYLGGFLFYNTLTAE